MIVPMQREHAAQVAKIHCIALAGDFLPSLGIGFLTEFYRAALDLGVGWGFVAIEADQLVGFILGSADTSVLFKRVLAARTLPLGLKVLAALMRNPTLIGKVLETFLYPSKEDDIPEKAELVVIGLDPQHRRQGLGKQLVHTLNKTFSDQGVKSYKVTVLQSNQGANSFYQSLGFKYGIEFQLYQKKWNLYTYSIQ
jgi:ribosomal protein S18 acetylase RimI-like enzyme